MLLHWLFHSVLFHGTCGFKVFINLSKIRLNDCITFIATIFVLIILYYANNCLYSWFRAWQRKRKLQFWRLIILVQICSMENMLKLRESLFNTHPLLLYFIFTCTFHWICVTHGLNAFLTSTNFCILFE